MKNEEKENYIIIPRRIIEQWDEDTLRIPIYCSLCKTKGLDGIARTSLETLIEDCGYSPKSNGESKQKIKQRIKDVLIMLKEKEYISFDKSLVNIRSSDNIKIVLNRNWGEDKTYSCISLIEINNILNYKQIFKDNGFPIRNVMPCKLLYMLAYIRVNKPIGSKEKPEVYFNYIANIAKKIYINERTVTHYIEVLQFLDIIATDTLPRYKDKNNNWHTDLTLFVDKKEGWEKELEWGKEYIYKHRNKTKGEKKIYNVEPSSN